MHSGAPIAQEPNRPSTPFGLESLTYRVFARWVIWRSTRQIRTTPPGVGRWDWRDDGYLDVSSDEMSQTFTVLSKLPLTIHFPSGLKLTLRTGLECP